MVFVCNSRQPAGHANLYWCFIDKLLEDLLHSTKEEDFYNLQKGAIALIAVTSHQVKMFGDFYVFFLVHTDRRLNLAWLMMRSLVRVHFRKITLLATQIIPIN